MLKPPKVSRVKATERRKHWNDRRVVSDRRHSQRLRLITYDCRAGSHRRTADISGELSEGEIWWNNITSQSVK